MVEKIALVLPAYNEGPRIEKSLYNVKTGIEMFPEYKFVLYTTDDASPDDTTEQISKWSNNYGLDIAHHRNQENLGLVETLKQAYSRILDEDYDFILKTDLDADFDQSEVLRAMVPYAKTDAEVVAGIRWREFTKEENPYEFDRRTEILEIMEKERGLKKMDPPSAGSQLYQTNAIREILQQPIVSEYNRKWGLDFLIPIVAANLGQNVEIVNIEKGSYDPARRGRQKVKDQYDAYTEIIASLKGVKPSELSKLYGK